MDLLLTHGYFLAEDPKEHEIMKPYAPLGLLYLSSHLRARGFDVEIYDSTFGSLEELAQVIASERPRAVGVYGNLMTRANVLRIVAAARAAGCRVVLGGPDPPNYAEEYLSSGADAIVNGEGEVSLEALLRFFGRSRAFATSVRERQLEPARDGSRARRRDVSQLHVVRPELVARDAQQLVRTDAFAREEVVDGAARGVARPALVADENPSAAAAEDERRAETGGSAADDDHVETRHAFPV